MKKTIATILLILVGLALISCAPAEKPLEITPEEAKNVINSLLPDAVTVNEIFFGEGLKCEPPASDGAVFCPVTADCGFKTVDEIKALAEKVYSAGYLDSVYVSVFEGTKDDGEGIAVISPRYKVISGVLNVNITAKRYNIRTVTSVDNVEITEKTPEYVKVTATADGEKMTFTLTKQAEKWLFAGPTY
ncbi:MAG: hypothetical protein KBT31_01500 [Firmicutes bacterium]|nr:hypothetical protein [Candidatus Colimorpha enterica]